MTHQVLTLRSTSTFTLSVVQVRTMHGDAGGWCYMLTLSNGHVAYRSNTGAKDWALRNALATFGSICA